MSFYKENEQNTILLMFSCPGRIEKDEDRPCAGITGDNLKILLEELHKTHPLEFPEKRESYYINNAWDQVEYEGSTGKTEASKSDILTQRNLNRLASEISHVEKIICFGDRAKSVVKKLIDMKSLKPGIPIYLAPHLGFQSINRRIKTDVDNNVLIKGEDDNTKKRLVVIAKNLLETRMQTTIT